MIFDRIARFFRVTCPACKKGKLVSKKFIRTSCIDNKIKRPSAMEFLQCDFCNARFKFHSSGKMEMPSREEWDKYCS